MIEPRRTFLQRLFFGSGPSKELTEVQSKTNGLKHASRLLLIRSEDLARSAAEIVDVAEMLRSDPDSN